MIFVHFQGKPFNITVIQFHVRNTDFEEVEGDQFCEYLQGPVESRQKKKKEMSFLLQ